MRQQFDELVAARDQMEQLRHAIVEIGVQPDLDSTLGRVLVAARDLTDARYAALGMRGDDGSLVSFRHTGMDSETVKRVGREPAGKGLLGVLLNRTEPLRIDDLATDPAVGEFPEHYPPMHAFLGVPITVGDTHFGSLYLAADQPSRTFSDSDEIAAQALAAAAAVAIEKAQSVERLRAVASWTKASREITTELLSGVDPHATALQLIADRARRLADAEQAIVLVPADAELPVEDVDTLMVAVASGLHASEVIGQLVPVDGSTTGEVFRSGAPVITEAFHHPIHGFTDVGQRPAIVMPLRAHDGVLGVIAVARNQYRPRFDTGYLALMRDFADHAAVALKLAAGREQARELAVLSDRERIAHDLHDHVIQRLFAAGIDLQGTTARCRSAEIANRLTNTVEELQGTINDIRATIFRLQSSVIGGNDFRERIHQRVTELTEQRDLHTTLQLSGPLSVVTADLAEHAEAVVTEALSNTVRHSGATRLTVQISVKDELSIDITDNGRGIPADNQRRSGLASMENRAVQAGGEFRITTPPNGGTHLHWTAPLIGL